MTFWGVAAISLLIGATSCDNEIVEKANTGTDNHIKFQTVLGKQTKAAEFTNTSWMNGNIINVKAYVTGETSTTPALTWTLTRNGSGAWDYTAVTQPGYSLDYYAVYPATSISGYTGNGEVASFGYTILAEASQQDLLAASNSTSATDVDLEFQHVLSQINFALQGTADVKVQVNSISLANVLNTGTLTFYANGTAWAWITGSGTTGYTYALPATTVTPGTAKLNLNDDTNGLMLMPQEFSSSTAAFTISYDLINIVSGATLVNDGSTTAYFKDFAIDSWEIGTSYQYVVDFTNYFVPGGNITFDVTVADWTDAATIVKEAQPTKASIEAAITAHNANHSTATKYTINVPVALEDEDADVVLGTFDGSKFVAGDKIVIELKDAATAGKIKLLTGLNAMWELSTSGSVVTLEKKAAVAPTYTGTGITNAALLDNIAGQASVATGENAFTIFPIKATGEQTTPEELTSIPGFAVGDQVWIEYPSSINLGNLTTTDTEWEKSVVGNFVVFKRITAHQAD